MAIWVELTGSQRADAMITVIAAESATEKALSWLSLVICFPTVCISPAQNTASPMASPTAQRVIIQKGIPTCHHAIAPAFTISFMAASGPIAFATSFAPCAKLRSPTANISGILKSLLINFLEFLKIADFLL